jgi:DNA primase
MRIDSLIFTLAPQLKNTYTKGHNYVMVCCPFHQERTPSCSVSTEKPVFFCHSCQEGGHTSRFLRQLGMGAEAAREAVKGAGLDKPRNRIVDGLIAKYQGKNPYRGQFILNEDLLDDYRLAPKSLISAGFRKETLRHFEVGFDQDNFRITFPLRNVYGELVGISGRAALDGIEPRYKIYRTELTSRTDFGVPKEYDMEAVKSSLLWHGHLVYPLLYEERAEEVLILTEGFKAAMAIWQAGYQNVAAIVGAYLSDTQSELIANMTRHACLFLDNNPAGWKGTYFAANRLLKKGIKVVVARYPDDREQPDALGPREVQQALRDHMNVSEWRQAHERVVSEAAWKGFFRKALREAGQRREEGAF